MLQRVVVARMAPEDILRAFGHHWIQYTGKQGYGAMFQMLGNDVMTFLTRLPELHDHIALVFQIGRAHV